MANSQSPLDRCVAYFLSPIGYLPFFGWANAAMCSSVVQFALATFRSVAQTRNMRHGNNQRELS